MLKRINADLHIHSCLSPCGDIEMSPKNIVESAISKDLGIIAVCDHNSSENAAAVKKAAKGTGLTVFPGIEVASEEEVHILGIFDNINNLSAFQKIVYDNLQGENDEELFGYQMIINDDDEISELNPHLLIGATTLSVNRITELIRELEGLAIASHIDRERFSLIGQLGFVPEGIELDAMELSPLYMKKEKKLSHPLSSGLPLITSSDAHYLKDIGESFTGFIIAEPTIAEIKKALENRDGRSVASYT